MRKILSTFVAIAALAAAAHINEEIPGGTPDGTLATFTLANPAIASSLSVHANGLLTYQGVDYDVTAAGIVFRPDSIPRPGWTLRASYDTPPPDVLISIDAGGPGDQYFSPASSCAPGGTCTDASIGTTPEQTLRYGYLMTTLHYKIPAPVGSCDLVLLFEEPRLTAGQRVFTITANGQSVVDVDIFLRAGAIKTPTVVSLTVPVDAGKLLDLAFVPKPGTWNAIVNRISAVCHPAP